MYRLLPALVLLIPAAFSQPADLPRFDVASVKRNTSGAPPTSNFPLGPGDVYIRNGGYFNATGQPLAAYIYFAYKIMGNQARSLRLPDWVSTERYDIQARVQGDPGKDDMRLLMRSLLADRFHLAARYEEREVPVMALTLVKPGKTGPQLRPHASGAACPTEAPDPSTNRVVDGTPVYCNGVYPVPSTNLGRLRFAGRNLTLSFIAETFSAGSGYDRPLVDQTGLTGTFDFAIEFTPERRGPQPSAAADSDAFTLSFEEALRDQLGIKLQSRKGPIRVIVIDRVERPTEN